MLLIVPFQKILSTLGAHYKGVRWRTGFLILLLILGQGMLLDHVVRHQLDHTFTQQDVNDDCGFCAVGGHMAANTLSPPSMPTIVWARVAYLPSVAQCLASLSLQTLGARGPPLLSVA